MTKNEKIKDVNKRIAENDKILQKWVAPVPLDRHDGLVHTPEDSEEYGKAIAKQNELLKELWSLN